MKEITYLFGAGASVGAVPLVNEMNEALEDFRDVVNNISPNSSFFERKFGSAIIIDKTKSDYIKELNWLITESKKHVSIDTLAKKLFLRNESDKLRILKILLSGFLQYIQFTRPHNNRYDSFYATILNNSLDDFPRHVKILSWNYDSQFEIAFNEYSQLNTLTENQEYLNIIQKYSNGKLIDTESFSIVKINGSSGLHSYSKGLKYDLGSQPFLYTNDFVKFIGNERKIISALLAAFHLLKSDEGHESQLSFAWEKDPNDNNIIDTARLLTINTNILVVIGYSFPYFNREIDRQIINNMQNLEKVYFQDKLPDNIKTRFMAIRNDIELIEIRTDLEQFLIPDEM